jgi:hypothetical protein
MLPKLDICAAAIAALTITLVDVAAAQDKISGKVVDTGLDSASGGIAGVRIVVTDLMSQKTVGEGVTTANGDYSIEIGNAKVPLIASFAKIGYFARPTRQLVTSVSQSQPTTRLSRASASDGYYKAVAENIWKAKGDDPDGLNSFLSAVSSLPGKEKSTVLTELRVKNTSAYRQFLTADEISISSRDWYGLDEERESGLQDDLRPPGCQYRISLFVRCGSDALGQEISGRICEAGRWE